MACCLVCTQYIVKCMIDRVCNKYGSIESGYCQSLLVWNKLSNNNDESCCLFNKLTQNRYKDLIASVKINHLD